MENSVRQYTDEGIVDKFEISTSHPNPFNTSTTIVFNIAVGSHCKMNIFNMYGQLIQTVLDKELRMGKHEIVWDPGFIPAGIYFIELEKGDTKVNKSHNVILMK